MSRDRIIDVDRTGAVVATRGLATSRHPRSDVRCLAASPRIRVVGAPVRRTCVGDPPIGAAENSPRVDGLVAVSAGTHAVFVPSRPTEGIRVEAVWESRGMSVALCGRGAGSATPGRCRRKGFVCDRHIGVGTGALRRESFVPGSPSTRTECTRISHWLRERRRGASRGLLEPWAPRRRRRCVML
jgi:hypothetical protein